MVSPARGRSSSTARRRHAPVRLDALVLVPAGGTVTPSVLAGGTVTDVDLAVINEGDESIDSVVAQWASLDQTQVGARPLLEPVGRVSPGVPETVQLQLFRSCSASLTAPVPSVLLTWSRDGVPQRMIVQPYGLDRLWSQLPAACPTFGDGPVSALDLHVANVVIHAKSLRLTMSFDNQDEVPLIVSDLTISGRLHPGQPRDPNIRRRRALGGAGLVDGERAGLPRSHPTVLRRRPDLSRGVEWVARDHADVHGRRTVRSPGHLVLQGVRPLLSARQAGGLLLLAPADAGLDELVDLAVEDGCGVARLVARSAGP